MTITTRVLHYASRGYGLREAIEQAQKDAEEDEKTLRRAKRLLACYRYTPAVQNKLKHQQQQ
jgi:hypothetical protein